MSHTVLKGEFLFHIQHTHLVMFNLIFGGDDECRDGGFYFVFYPFGFAINLSSR